MNLADEKGHALGLHLSDSVRILVEVTRREALIGTVEERKVLLSEHNLNDLGPLLSSRVDSRGLRYEQNRQKA